MSNTTETYQGGRAQSTFVTVLAWIFIVMSAFSTIISLLQNLIFFLVFPSSRMLEFVQSPEIAPRIPPIHRLMFSYIQVVMPAVLFISLFTLASSIALLKRKNWGRVVFIALMALGIVYSLGLIFLLPGLLEEVPPGPAGREFEVAFSVMRIFMIGFSLGLALLLGWIIKRLVSKSIRGEFIRS